MTLWRVNEQLAASNIVFQPATPDLMDHAKKRFYQVMGAKYRFDPSDERARELRPRFRDQRDTIRPGAANAHARREAEEKQLLGCLCVICQAREDRIRENT